jgi:hypothetical protein
MTKIFVYLFPFTIFQLLQIVVNAIWYLEFGIEGQGNLDVPFDSHDIGQEVFQV